ncbi:lipopolysaccharide biosynthesis protein [Agrobacterium rubi]|uniref:Oligosaccharide flippase family protein n=3 Tax=Agrobacterium rubi TaxID=28099 RepID=A0AAE7USP2_9HYPH|nr:oligosaccharide flippase family protein [Agrobacterium rubi]MCL6653025.1 sugar transporter [Agrobacterium rubi]NTE88761.1 oligosaccharide flippase family protein [Agrobacterium rubi]NTF04589.1 oligosaccharide flippase family protein [Agrobacterium rubi]NTF10122.1 oligosaccharide flippase family protein [Agrobacterium rubi]NTF21700.1 oligosaccharide flippase family protein [Agrobacterium rubi]
MISNDKKDKPRLISMLLSYSASSASLLIANAAQLITFAILARSFGAEEFGRYVSFIAITSIAVHLCGLGASECLVRRVPQDPTCFPRIFGHNLILTFVSGAVLVALGTALLPEFISFGETTSQSVLTTFQLVLTNVVLVRLIMLGESIFLAHSKYGAANASVVGFAFIRTVTAILACLVFQVSTVQSWATWQLAAHLFTLALYAYFALRIGRPKYVIERDEIRLGLLFATPFIFRAIRQNVDLLVLGFVAGAEVVGSYGVARRITDSSYMAIDALNRLVYPRLAVASMSGIHHAFRLTMRILGVAFALGLIAAIVIFFSASFMPLIFGPEYVSLPQFLRIMAWLIVLVAIWSIAVDLLGAAGEHASRAWVLNLSNGIGAMVIGLAAWAWPPYGIFVAGYMIELSIVLAAWLVVRFHVARSLARTREVPL